MSLKALQTVVLALFVLIGLSFPKLCLSAHCSGFEQKASFNHACCQGSASGKTQSLKSVCCLQDRGPIVTYLAPTTKPGPEKEAQLINYLPFISGVSLHPQDTPSSLLSSSPPIPLPLLALRAQSPVLRI